MPDGPEARVVGGAGNLLAEFRRELAEHGRDVDADLLEHAALHHRHDAAAARRAAVVGALQGVRTKRPAVRGRQAARPRAGRPPAPRRPRRCRRATLRTRRARAALRVSRIGRRPWSVGPKIDNEGGTCRMQFGPMLVTDCHKSGRVSVPWSRRPGRIMSVRLTPNPLTRRRLLAGVGSSGLAPRRGATLAAASDGAGLACRRSFQPWRRLGCSALRRLRAVDTPCARPPVEQPGHARRDDWGRRYCRL